MTDHRRRQSAAAINPITFPNPSLDHHNPLDFMTWAEGIKESSFNKHKNYKPGAWTRRAPIEVGSDTPSPELWQPGSAVASPSHQPTSREQTIDGYRKEMMELVRFVPEAAYELSLRDLVELPKMERSVEKIEEEKAPETTVKKERSVEKIEEEKAPETTVKKGARRAMSKSGSMVAGGFLLKMFLPFSFAAGKRKSKGGSAGDSAKLSRKLDAHKGVNGGLWNRKGYSDSRSSSSTTTSNSSTTTTTTVSRNSGSWKLLGCSFFLA